MTHESIIIVAVDGSDASTAAVVWAANTASKRGEPLRLASAYAMPQFLYAEGMVPPKEVTQQLQKETLGYIEKAAAAARSINPNLKIGHTIAEGSAIDMLLEMSRTCTMIVMGSRGLGGLSGMVMGSVSAAVVSHAHCPVVVVREDSTLTKENKNGPVVVGVDGSTVSKKATEYAFAEAAARGCGLIAVHTWMDGQLQSSFAGIAAPGSQWEVVEQEQHDQLADYLKEYEERFPAVKVTRVVTRDRPVRALTDAAAGAQLLVVGSHGRGGFKGMLLGSTSRALLQSAPCPMMVVRFDSIVEPATH